MHSWLQKEQYAIFGFELANDSLNGEITSVIYKSHVLNAAFYRKSV